MEKLLEAVPILPRAMKIEVISTLPAFTNDHDHDALVDALLPLTQVAHVCVVCFFIIFLTDPLLFSPLGQPLGPPPYPSHTVSGPRCLCVGHHCQPLSAGLLQTHEKGRSDAIAMPSLPAVPYVFNKFLVRSLNIEYCQTSFFISSHSISFHLIPSHLMSFHLNSSQLIRYPLLS